MFRPYLPRGGSRAGQKEVTGVPILKKLFLAQKATATNPMHSNDLEACGMKLCCFWFHSDVKFLTRSLYSGERQWPTWASCLAHLSRRLKWAIVIAHRPSSVRPSSVVVRRRPSVRRKLSHFQLLLWNHWTEFNETWQKARSQRSLPSLCFSSRSEKQDGRPGLWLAETFSTSSLKPLNRIQRNLKGSKISKPSTKFVFFGPIGKTRWPPLPLIGWDIFDFSSETTE